MTSVLLWSLETAVIPKPYWDTLVNKYNTLVLPGMIFGKPAPAPAMAEQAHKLPCGLVLLCTADEERGGVTATRELKPMPPGGIGEIYIAGAGVAKGYLKRQKEMVINIWLHIISQTVI